jgi:hypothetical protein
MLAAANIALVAFFPSAALSRFAFGRRRFACFFSCRRFPAALALTH